MWKIVAAVLGPTIAIVTIATVAIAQPPVDPVVFEQGQQLYENHCALCHQDAGTGTPPTFPALAQYVGSLFQSAKPLVASSLAMLATLATAAGRLLANLLGATAPVFRSLEPIATTAILASFVMMSCTIALVVARDLRKPHTIHEDCR